MGRARSTPLFALFAALLVRALPVGAQDGPAHPTAVPSPDEASAPAALSRTNEFEAWLSAQRDAIGRSCNRRAVSALGERWVVACGETGVWIARRDSDGRIVLVRTDDLGGPVVGLFQREGRVWAEVMRREARDVAAVDENASHAAFPSGDSEPSRPTEAPAPAPAAKPRSPPVTPEPNAMLARDGVPEGHVTQVLLGEVVIDIGRESGLRHGDRVELSVLADVPVGEEQAEGRTVVAVGVVRAVSERFARVALGIDERVPKGALARPVARAPSESRGAPPRLGRLWHAGFMARPFIALGDLGGGLMTDGSVGYRFESDIHLELLMSPFGWGTGNDQPAVTASSVFAKVSYDTDFFEIGFGIGGQSINDTSFGTDSGSGTVLVQQLRLGALDGLVLDTVSHAVLFHSQFRFTDLVGRGLIPVGERYWLLFAGGGGSAGFGYGEMGVRALLRGNGDRGSFFFTGSVGGAGVFENIDTRCSEINLTYACHKQVLYSGPMIGAGGEWRF
jgi:hypothetical protein